jgi:hypothetical protein
MCSALATAHARRWSSRAHRCRHAASSATTAMRARAPYWNVAAGHAPQHAEARTPMPATTWSSTVVARSAGLRVKPSSAGHRSGAAAAATVASARGAAGHPARFAELVREAERHALDLVADAVTCEIPVAVRAQAPSLPSQLTPGPLRPIFLRLTRELKGGSMGYQLQIDREERLARVWLFCKTSVEEQRQWLDDLVNHPGTSANSLSFGTCSRRSAGWASVRKNPALIPASDLETRRGSQRPKRRLAGGSGSGRRHVNRCGCGGSAPPAAPLDR